jgi:hypothetical protein
MKTKTVIVWGRADLLSKSVETLLSSREEWDVICISNKESVEVLIREVKKVMPDVVILNSGDCPVDSLLALVLIQGYPVLKVIAMSLESNSMEVYSKQKLFMKEVTNLLSLVDD